MSESSFRTFAIIGAGNLGTYIAKELLKQKQAGKATDVVLLTRSSSTNHTVSRLASQGGARVVTVDYTSRASLSSALEGIDVVVSTVAHSGLAGQRLLVSAAKAAGVRLFVPSEYGNPTDGAPEPAGIHRTKQQLHQTLRARDVPYLLLFTGPWPDYWFVPALRIDLDGGKATVGADGNVPISWTSRADVARFLAHVLTALPPAQLRWRSLRIEGERASFNDVLERYAAKTGRKVDVAYRSIAELEEEVGRSAQLLGEGADAELARAAPYLHLTLARGKGVVGTPEELSNALYPGWNPKKVVDVIAP